jgi:hypothetical protein
MRFNSTGCLPKKRDVEEIINGAPKEKYYCYRCQRIFFNNSLPCYHIILKKENDFFNGIPNS